MVPDEKISFSGEGKSGDGEEAAADKICDNGFAEGKGPRVVIFLDDVCREENDRIVSDLIQQARDIFRGSMGKTEEEEN